MGARVTYPPLFSRTSRILVFAAFILLGVLPVFGEEISGRVTWIQDGDTIRVDGVGTVRLLGIDTPEMKASERDNFYLRRGLSRRTIRRTARDALHFNIRHLKGKRVTLRPGNPQRDDYGRLLAYVHLPDGRMINLMLIEGGLATVFRRYSFDHKEPFLEAERKARQGKQGMWKYAKQR